jgi:hypothetical protein
MYACDPEELTGNEKKVLYNSNLFSFAHNNSKSIIKRCIQGIYGDIVDVVCSDKSFSSNEFVKVEHPNFSYISQNDNNEKIESHVFWISKNSIIPIKEIIDFDVLKYIPCEKYILQKENFTVETLILPLMIDGLWYSVGTKFVCKNFNKNNFEIAILSKNNKYYNVKLITCGEIEKKFFNEKKYIKNKRKRFIDLLYMLNDYLQENKLCVPYVWGGTTIIPLSGFFEKVEYNQNIFWSWKNNIDRCYCGGIDCSALINVYARLAGFDFTYRNSLIQKNNLKKVGKKIKSGDIVWVPGHVMIIDVKKNMCIESAGYSSGYGTFIINPLHDRFKNVFTAKDLYDLYKNKKPLIIKNKDLNEIIYNHFEIVSLL